MGYTYAVLIAFIATIAIVQSAYPRAQASSILEDLLVPGNAERVLQLLQLQLAAGASRSPRFVIDEPPKLKPNVLPKQLLPEILKPRMALPRASKPVVELPMAARFPEIYPPIAPPTVVTERVYPGVPIPQPCAVTQGVPEVYSAAPVAYPTAPVAYPTAPVPMVNPFLPAASPVSALAPPTSNLLPPVIPTQVRSHFLRKIPIPPPSL